MRQAALHYLLTLLFLACGNNLQAKNYIVCVGISDYPGTKSDLNLSANDATTIKKLYEKNGHAETRLLTNEQATVENVKETLRSLYSQASSNDAIVFFFSGHGTPGSFVCHDGLLPYNALTTIMAACPTKTKMVFADACYSGQARKENTHKKPREDKQVMFFLSSRTNETSIEQISWKNGFFTAYLERGLRGGADNNKDKTITARELFEFVSQGVQATTRGRQHPVMWGNFDNEMPVMRW